MQSPAAPKYHPFPPVAMTCRYWPEARLTHPPVWMSTDLRDGNQALFEPMNGDKKLRFFKMLCAIGVKEIEVAFPAASQTDFDFVRALIAGAHIPDDVAIEVLTQARPALIERTFAALAGAKRAIVHLYTATSAPFREMVFGMSQAELIDMTVASVRHIKACAEKMPDTRIMFEYSPETFTATELPFALEICDAVTAAWGANAHDKVILNLPTTVEMATPNLYADQIEWMHTRLARREGIILSLHPHNDRGTAVAAAELGLMAGAERVEGCLFGNGERTGNVDLVTLALNLYTQGVDPGLDFSDINAVARTFEACTGLPIHPRHPYVGDLVFTAFSGSHQDAIKKGMTARRESRSPTWNVPYLPIDPADVGRSYDALIRVNSQSGKGGIAWLMESSYGIVLPRRLLVEFSGIVQRQMDDAGREMSAADLWRLFSAAYLETETQPDARLVYQGHQLDADGKGIALEVVCAGTSRRLTGQGNGPIDAAIHALAHVGIHAQVASFEERATRPSQQGEASAAAFMEVGVLADGESADGEFGEQSYGVGLDEDIVTASLKALVSGVNRRRGL
ncbi:2-isopropylmalate synthase [Betaproteobacteria bacterium]|nr:2-isopropylmalate synthase [Betaproteobacteria bacterium]GHU44833.1 2-isopropylmalate synthase [Betaproteobacteria bacterium]